MTDDRPADIRVELAKLLTDVDQASAITADEVHQTQVYLESLWQKTEGDEEAHALITQTWEHVTLVAEQNAALTFQVIASGTIAQTALAEEKIAREELSSIQDAISDMDEDLPALSGFVETIREWAQEDFDDWMADEGWPEAMAEAFEEIRGEVVDKVHRLSCGGSLSASNKFVAILMGRRATFTPRQEELFANFMETFEEIVRVEAAHRA